MNEVGFAAGQMSLASRQNKNFQFEVDLGFPLAATSKAGSWSQWILSRDQVGDLLGDWDDVVDWFPRSPMTNRKNGGFHPTAIKRSKAPAPMRAYLLFVGHRAGLRILYHGVGRDLPGAIELEGLGANEVIVYDPYHPVVGVRQRPDGLFDEVHSCYTLNVVSRETGQEIVRDIYSFLKDPGIAVITVRDDFGG